jgi:hypothetical protein
MHKKAAPMGRLFALSQLELLHNLNALLEELTVI